MTAQQFIGSSEVLNHLDPTDYNIILNLMEGFAKHMCDKQKEICTKHVEMEGRHQLLDILSKESIVNSPYPEELQ